MSKYRKKPVVIDAIQFVDGAKNRHEVLEFTGLAAYWRATADAGEIVIKTLEGEMVGSVGDWIIRGVNGEIYPCKPDIFAKTYDAA